MVVQKITILKERSSALTCVVLKYFLIGQTWATMWSTHIHPSTWSL